MNPNIWGPHAWFFLHSITLAYPECPSKDDKVNTKNFFYSLRNILPCTKCKINYQKHIEKNPLTNNILCSKKKLIKWLIDIHNYVNKMKGEREYTYEEIMNYYSSKYNDNNNSIYDNKLFVISVTIFIFIILLTLFFIFKINFFELTK